MGLFILYPWWNGYRTLSLSIKNRAPFDSILTLGILIKLVPRTTFLLYTSIRLSTTMLEVSSSHLWMAYLAIMSLRYYPLISTRRNSFAHGEPLHIRSYLLAWKMLEPHSSVRCPMLMILNILLNHTLTTSLLIHSDGRTSLVILETYSWDAIIIIYDSIHINVFFALRRDVC